MTCASCGCDQMAGAQFCVRCGMRMAPMQGDWGPVASAGYAAGYGFAAPTYVPEKQARVGQNLQALGIAWCFFGAYRLVAAAAVSSAARALGWTGHPFGHVLWPLIGVATLFYSGLSVLVGIGLLRRRPWARGLAIFAGILSLPKLPVGTALGIYTFWVLGSRTAREEWRRIEVA